MAAPSVGAVSPSDEREPVRGSQSPLISGRAFAPLGQGGVAALLTF